jgi:LPPG:FO 2-phospho-L-lactate transferase
MIALICGGVGGAKIARGLYQSLPPDSLCIVVNTADDTEHWGLHVSPDLDTVTYTLADLAGEQGWGIAGDSFTALEMMTGYGAAGWFRIGDRDLATNVYRTMALRDGKSLTEVAAHLTRSLGVCARILPMTNARVSTGVRVAGEWIDFQEYFVHRGHRVPVEAARYVGIDHARATPEVMAALGDAEVILLANSNPVLSILPVLAVAGVRECLQTTNAPRVAISPMLGSGSIAGPAGELMQTIGRSGSSLGVAGAYQGLIDGIVIAADDRDQASAIEEMGIRVLCTDTIMRDDRDKGRLAQETVAFARSLR